MTDTARPPSVATPAAPVETSRWERMAGPVSTIGGLGLLTLALHLRDPHDGGSWGYCPSALLGLSCPGCGGLRAVNDLTDGRFGAAASSNLLFIVLLPVLVFLLGRWALDRWTGHPRVVSPQRTRAFLVVVGALAVVFTIARNLPGSWLAP